MTRNIIEKIRAEVERRNGYISVTHFVEELLSVLSDLEKEEKLNSQWSEEDNIMVKDIINAIDKNYASSDWHEMVDWLKSLHLKVKSEKPTTAEGLEEEMIAWHKEHFKGKRKWEETSGEYLTRESQLDIARHFAKWGAEHRGSSEIPNDLEEAAIRAAQSDMQDRQIMEA